MMLSAEARLMWHPGPTGRQRVFCEPGRLGGAFRLTVQCGADLLGSIERWGTERRYPTLAFRLLHGAIGQLRVMTGGPDPTGRHAATFHGPHVLDCPAYVLGGHGVMGAGFDRTVIHAHAVFIDAHGMARGCHLIHGCCVAAGDGIHVAVFPVEGALLHVRRDAETQFDIFFPEAVSDAESDRGVMR